MCGILGIVTCRGRTPAIDDATVERMRDTMARRGPDGSGLWRRENVVLAHRRLAVVAPGPEGAQPWISPSGSALVYNGELYNDRDVRTLLERRGLHARTACDTETVALAIESLGLEAMLHLRGMYAFGFVDANRAKLILARDPLGIKPLFWAQVGDEILFASDVRALLDHPHLVARPDMVAVSAYLTTIRLTLGERTLFAGIHTVLPGQWLEFDLTGTVPRRTSHDWWGRVAAQSEQAINDQDVRQAIEDSVRRHLRSDVPVCCLLSGGLDSTIIATVAKRESDTAAQLTYCAGARVPDRTLDDFHFAREVASILGSTHIETEVTESLFLDRWPWMVRENGMPLSTPNEVAIHEVARRLRADGKVVALSGEGADELFGGYDAVMDDATRRFSSLAGCNSGEWRSRGGTIMLESSAWIPAGAKEGILSEPALAASENDGYLSEYCYDQFRRLAEQRAATDPMQAALMFQRRINLEGLLRRLDSATMLASVEGRTPFSDQEVTRLAESLPSPAKYSPASSPKGKLILRRAFTNDIPSSVLTRPKASFPLPFQEWGQHAAAVLDTSTFAREIFSEPLRLVLSKQSWTTQGLWRIGWPAVNLAIWGKRWWG